MQQLMGHLGAAEQGHMAGAIGNPAVGWRKCQLVAGFLVLPKGTAQGDQTIANQSICQQIAFGCRRGGYCKAGDACRQGQRRARIR